MLNSDELKIKREKFLITLYFLAGKKVGQEVKNEELFNTIWINDLDEKSQVIREASRQGWIGWNNFENTFISLRGLVEVKKIMDSNYAEREYSVLNSIYELGNRTPKEMVLITDLAIALQMSVKEVYSIVEDLENRKKLIGSIEEAVWILPAGIEELEETKNNPEKPTENFPSNIYHTVIYGSVGALQQNSHHSRQHVNQTVNITNNPEFDTAISSILELIKESKIDDDDKEEISREVENINNLALKEPSQNAIDKAKIRLTLLETMLKGAELFGKATPYLPAIYNYFETLTKQLT